MKKRRAVRVARSSNSNSSTSKSKQLRLDLFVKINEAREKVWQAMINMTLEHGHGPVFKVEEIMKEAGIKDKELVIRALEQLRAEKLIFRHNSGGYKMTLKGLWRSGIQEILDKMEAMRLRRALEKLEEDKKLRKQLHEASGAF